MNGQSSLLPARRLFQEVVVFRSNLMSRRVVIVIGTLHTVWGYVEIIASEFSQIEYWLADWLCAVLCCAVHRGIIRLAPGPQFHNPAVLRHISVRQIF